MAPPSASAVGNTVTWANGAASTNWNDATSWTGGAVPGADDIASVPKGGTRPALEAEQTAAINGISLSCKDSNKCHLNGTGTFLLGASGLAFTMESGSGGTGGTIAPNFVLTADQTWNLGGAKSSDKAVFTFTGSIGEDGTPRALTFAGGKGIAVLNGADSDFSGGFSCLSGVLRFGASSTLDEDGRIQKGPLGIGSVTLGNVSVTDINKLTLHNPLVISGDLTFSRNGQTSNQTLTFAPSGTDTPSSAVLFSETSGTQHTITLFNNRLKPTISQALGESGATRIGLAIAAGSGTGSGTDGQLTLAGTTPNTFTGTVTINGARLRLAKADGVTAVPGPIEIRGGMLVLGAAEQISNDSIMHVDSANGVLSFEKNLTETIRQLWVDGVRLPDGTYTTANASFITGSGELVVADRTATTIVILL